MRKAALEKPATERQRSILDVIRAFTTERGYPPSVREIGERVGLSSSSTIHAHLKALERRGLISRDPTKPRAMRSGASFQGHDAVDHADPRPRRGRGAHHRAGRRRRRTVALGQLRAARVRRVYAARNRAIRWSMQRFSTAISSSSVLSEALKMARSSSQCSMARLPSSASIVRLGASVCSRRIAQWRQSTRAMSRSSVASKPSSAASKLFLAFERRAVANYAPGRRPGVYCLVTRRAALELHWPGGSLPW